MESLFMYWLIRILCLVGTGWCIYCLVWVIRYDRKTKGIIKNTIYPADEKKEQ